MILFILGTVNMYIKKRSIKVGPVNYHIILIGPHFVDQLDHHLEVTSAFPSSFLCIYAFIHTLRTMHEISVGVGFTNILT